MTRHDYQRNSVWAARGQAGFPRMFPDADPGCGATTASPPRSTRVSAVAPSVRFMTGVWIVADPEHPPFALEDPGMAWSIDLGSGPL